MLLAVFLLQSVNPALVDAAANSSQRVIDDGEWWRLFTAMFFHSDLVHLAGNLLFGSIFILLASRTLGPFLAWPLILASGVTANLVTAFHHHPEPFRAIGASTAVFGALGLLTGSGIIGHRPHRQRLAWLLIPGAGGLALFSWLGLGGEGIDMLGHAAGFATGLLLGVIAGAVRPAVAKSPD